MIETFRSIINRIIQPRVIFPSGVTGLFHPEENSTEARVKNLCAAFLISLCGPDLPDYEKALAYLSNGDQSSGGELFWEVGEKIFAEIETALEDSSFADRMQNLDQELKKHNPENLAEHTWSVFFPEAAAILGHEKERIHALRQQRIVSIERLNSKPIVDPAREILFTANALLTIPPADQPIDELPIDGDLKESLKAIRKESQQFWYDHPIPVGIGQEANEVIYGLKGLDRALEFEKNRGTTDRHSRATLVLSVSVTHKGLHQIAKQYLEREITRSGGFRNLNVYMFTEDDARALVERVIIPVAEIHSPPLKTEKLTHILGVDGEYGRHYSFLKAIAAFWQVFINPDIRATFKIDLDQVFPQEALVEETGKSAFQQFVNPQWGATGTDSNGQPVELGMIAGALVNEWDIHKSIFTPDVSFPQNPPTADEYIFYSKLPQAVSTSAEMMAPPSADSSTCFERIHVTGGTNGILVDALRRYRPFTPTFFGRAEDQAYIFSVLGKAGRRLAYLHGSGLIMRHDKEAFAQEAIRSAAIGKLIGDYVRILYFSAYPAALGVSRNELKKITNPFTGSFISEIPLTVVMLRFTFKTLSLFFENRTAEGIDFFYSGSRRIRQAMHFSLDKEQQMTRLVEEEKAAWNAFYDLLDFAEKETGSGNHLCRKIRETASALIKECTLHSTAG